MLAKAVIITKSEEIPSWRALRTKVTPFHPRHADVGQHDVNGLGRSFSRASEPSQASDTANPSSPRIVRRAARALGSSSTTRTRGLAIAGEGYQTCRWGPRGHGGGRMHRAGRSPGGKKRSPRAFLARRRIRAPLPAAAPRRAAGLWSDAVFDELQRYVDFGKHRARGAAAAPPPRATGIRTDLRGLLRPHPRSIRERDGCWRGARAGSAHSR